MTVPLTVVVAVIDEDVAVIVPVIEPTVAEEFNLTYIVSLTLVVFVKVKLDEYVPPRAVDISKFVGAVIVTLAVKPEPETPNVVGVDEEPKHEVKVAKGENKDNDDATSPQNKAPSCLIILLAVYVFLKFAVITAPLPII